VNVKKKKRKKTGDRKKFIKASNPITELGWLSDLNVFYYHFEARKLDPNIDFASGH